MTFIGSYYINWRRGFAQATEDLLRKLANFVEKMAEGGTTTSGFLTPQASQTTTFVPYLTRLAFLPSVPRITLTLWQSNGNYGNAR